MLEFGDLVSGTRLSGVAAGGDVTVVAVEVHGPGSATLTYRSADGRLDERIIHASDLAKLSVVSQRRWSFDADGAMFCLASEALRMQQAHLADPFAAVDTSNIEPYPHQIDAVYNRLLTRMPLRFLLADDPGAGKTIMSGLLIRELMLRGDVARCLIVAPGSLVEQWQDELWDKFNLDFELMSRAAVEASRAGNPFLDKSLLIARLDQISRSEELSAKLEASDWDLVIVDEANKMSAHVYGDEMRRTKRFVLGEKLRDRSRHLLLLTATPHNGRNEDFLAFMTLIDPERFAGRLRVRAGTGGGLAPMPDVSDVMRRRVKENLLTFDGRRLFPERHAHSLNFDLSDPETKLYEAVTAYVRDGMNRAARMQAEGDKRRGVVIGFALAGLQRRLASSPAAIFHSLRRRRDRLAEQASELRRLAASGEPVPVINLPKGVRPAELEDFDFDDYGDAELEDLERFVIDAATASESADELDLDVNELERLIGLADDVRRSGIDTKWIELRGLLRSEQFASPAPGEAWPGAGMESGAHSREMSVPATGRTTAPSADDSGGGACPYDAQPARKLIVFSEHRDTLEYVAGRIATELGRPEAVATIHGGIKRHDRRVIQDRFRVDPTVRVLVATDAAGEGVNLQVANMVVNYDLPWNPNRIEQRFGRVHRIGQWLPCHLWNLVAHRTREGQVFKRLFEKIEQQRTVYGDQVYDVLGRAQINTSLRDLLMRAIVADGDPAHAAWMDEVIDAGIGADMEAVLRERALVSGLADPAANDTIRRQMEIARTRKLQPWFVETFFTEALRLYGGRIAARERGRFEVTRVPAAVRAAADPRLGPVHDRYQRVTFDKTFILPGRADRPQQASRPGASRPGRQGEPGPSRTEQPSRPVSNRSRRQGDGAAGMRAELISPGTPLLAAVIAQVLADCGNTLSRGALLADRADPSAKPRLLVYLEHSITDGQRVNGARQVVSRRFHYVEIDRDGNAADPGAEPYLNYAPLSDDESALLAGRLDLDWADQAAEDTAKAWAIEHLAGPHFDEVHAITDARVAKVRAAVMQRLESEIRYWDRRAAEVRAEETAGRKPRLNSSRAQARAEYLSARLARRRLELDLEADLHNTPPTVAAAAVVLPQGWLDALAGRPGDPAEASVRAETDRRAVDAVLEAERALGRVPEPQHHSNPGYDVLSTDPTTGMCYFIEVKGHLPSTEQISVSRRQVGQAQCNPERWRLAVVAVPEDLKAEPEVRYLTDPFRKVTLHAAQTSVPLNVAELLTQATPPH